MNTQAISNQQPKPQTAKTPELTLDNLPDLITKYLERENPPVTLKSGETKHVNDLTLSIDEEGDAYFDLYDELFNEAKAEFEAERKATDAPKPEAVPAPAEAMVSPEEATKAQIRALELEVADLRLRVNSGGEVSREDWKALEQKGAQLKDLKDRLRREAALKERYKAEFLRDTPGTEQDFERLWNTTLRDEAILNVLIKTCSDG